MPKQRKSKAGAALVKAIRADLGDAYKLDEREEALLSLAAHQADDVERLEADIAERGTTVTGSTGQAVLNPSISEARQGRLALTKILAGITLPDGAAHADPVRGLGKSRAA
jgi:hypothetical protein